MFPAGFRSLAFNPFFSDARTTDKNVGVTPAGRAVTPAFWPVLGRIAPARSGNPRGWTDAIKRGGYAAARPRQRGRHPAMQSRNRYPARLRPTRFLIRDPTTPASG